jgi:Ion channel
MRFIEKLSIGVLFAMACISLLLFAGIYWHLEGSVQGPVSSPAGAPISFGNCVYFSVVTFTSLGYGDIVPRGLSKVVASSEVVLGLAFLGVFIARLSSAKQNYHLAQLYARDAQERLDDFATDLKIHREYCEEALKTIKKGESPARSLNKIQVDIYQTALRIRAYVSFEVSNDDFFSEMPIGAPARLLRRSTQLVQRVSSLACFPESLHSQRQRRIAKRIILQLAEIGEFVEKNTKDASLLYEARCLAMKCSAETLKIDVATAKVESKLKAQHDSYAPPT